MSLLWNSTQLKLLINVNQEVSNEVINNIKENANAEGSDHLFSQ